MTMYRKLLLGLLLVSVAPCAALAQQTPAQEINNILSTVDSVTTANPATPDQPVQDSTPPPAPSQTPQEGAAAVPSATPDVVAQPPQAVPGQVAAMPQQAGEPVEANPDNVLNPQTDIEKALSEQLAYLKPQVNVNQMPSLFFSRWEHDLIADARLGLTSSGPIPVAIDGSDPGLRDITLSGIVFRSSSDWTVWLNNVRVTPGAIPPEVIDIKVYKEYIELEWFDRSKNLIYPIRLRAHQRFNLDTRMFLPG